MSARSIQVEDKNNGIKKEGELEEIVEFSEEMKCVLEEVCDDKESIEDFDYWRPEDGDDEEDIKDRTATVASISEKEVEIEGEGFEEDSHSKGSVSRGALMGSIKKFFRPFVSVSLKFVRETEELIYSFMLNFNPYYFDAEKFSVSLEKSDDEFEINFKSPEEEYRRAVKQSFGLEE